MLVLFSVFPRYLLPAIFGDRTLYTNLFGTLCPNYIPTTFSLSLTVVSMLPLLVTTAICLMP